MLSDNSGWRRSQLLDLVVSTSFKLRVHIGKAAVSPERCMTSIAFPACQVRAGCVTGGENRAVPLLHPLQKLTAPRNASPE